MQITSKQRIKLSKIQISEPINYPPYDYSGTICNLLSPFAQNSHVYFS